LVHGKQNQASIQRLIQEKIAGLLAMWLRIAPQKFPDETGCVGV